MKQDRSFHAPLSDTARRHALAAWLAVVVAVAAAMFTVVPGAWADDPEPASEEREFSRRAVSFGLLHGGGGIFGIDFEKPVSDRVGIQLGVGIISAGGGLTYHYRPGLRSNHLYLGFWQQGLFGAEVQSVVGLTHVWRGKSRWTFQLGAGARVADGPELPERFEDTKVMLLFSLGLCTVIE